MVKLVDILVDLADYQPPPRNETKHDSSWRQWFDERAAIAEYDGGLSRTDAEAQASECCVNLWLNENPEPSEPDRCAWCGKPDQETSKVLPFGAEGRGHTWLHGECWSAWYQQRQDKARSALRTVGVPA